jgi:hypothetical protein
MNASKKTIKSAKKIETGFHPCWKIEYNEFEGSYFVDNTEYKLQVYVEKILNERTILPMEIEELLDLHTDVVNHDRDMEDCD